MAEHSKKLRKVLVAFDRYQKAHAVPGFLVAVAKKYEADDMRTQAALLTYYGFVSLFPLALVLLTVLSFVLHRDTALAQWVLNTTVRTLPLIGGQLVNNLRTLKQSGFSLLVELIITLLGSFGLVTAFQGVINKIFGLEKRNVLTGLAKWRRNVLILLAGGGMTIVALTVPSFLDALGHGFLIRFFIFILGVILTSDAMLIVMRLVADPYVPSRSLLTSAVISGIATQLLLHFSRLLLGHELQHLSSLYGSFAIVLGFLFWLYLVMQITLVALAAGAVQARGRWRVSLT